MLEAIQCLNRLYVSRADIDALDFEPRTNGLKFSIRLRGLPDALPSRAARIQAQVGGGKVLSNEEEEAYWKQAVTTGRENALIKVTLTSGKLVEVEAYFSDFPGVQRHYSVGGNLLWLNTNEIPPTLAAFLASQKLSALVIKGPSPFRLGYRPGPAFEQRVKQVFDPHNRFVTI